MKCICGHKASEHNFCYEIEEFEGCQLCEDCPSHDCFQRAEDKPCTGPHDIGAQNLVGFGCSIHPAAKYKLPFDILQDQQNFPVKSPVNL